MDLKLLIFDFDGTLVHTAPDIYEAINEFLESKGKPTLGYEEVIPEIGMGLVALFKNTFPETNTDEKLFHAMVEEFVGMYERRHLHNPSLFEGAQELLDTWKGQVAIISNKREKYIHSILKHMQLDTLPWVDIIGGDTLDVSKPHAKPFQQVLEKAGCPAEKALMIGDGEPDILGGINSGIKPVAVSFGYGDIKKLQELGAWKTVNSFHELKQLAESLS